MLNNGLFVDLIDYGFSRTDFLAFQALLDNRNPKEFIPGRIIESRREQYKVICEYGEVSAEIKGSFFNNLKEGDLFPVIGDFVALKYNNQGASLIDAVLPRRSRFSRVDFLGHAEGYAKNVREQVNAANFDYVFILSSLNNDFNISRMARYLTATMQSGGFPVFVLTKADLVEDYCTLAAEVQKLAREVPVICVSSKTGVGVEELSPFLEPAKTVIFLGSSGVGKSSLLNRLAGEELMEVKSIREDDSKGRHTTTFRQLFRLESGALVIDTPGMRELGLWDSKEGISLAFAEVEELFSQCKFSDCSHQTEPGCAVLAALEDGRLSQEQWKNYKAQSKENAFVMNHSAYLKQKQEFHKSIARNNKQRQKRTEIF
jgi:ribosome biogenesis GTPase